MAFEEAYERVLYMLLLTPPLDRLRIRARVKGGIRIFRNTHGLDEYCYYRLRSEKPPEEKMGDDHQDRPPHGLVQACNIL